jgi:hypothetical protein
VPEGVLDREFDRYAEAVAAFAFEGFEIDRLEAGRGRARPHLDFCWN